MYNGTNGQIQSNKFFVKPKTNKVVTDSNRGIAGVTRKPDKEMSEHDRKRKIELKLIDLGCTDADIAEKIDEARNSLQQIDSD